MGREVQQQIVDRALAKSRASTFGELATRIGVTPATLSQWRNGTHPIPERRLEQLCKLSGDDVGVWAIALMAEETSISSLRQSIRKLLAEAGKSVPAVALAITAALYSSDHAPALIAGVLALPLPAFASYVNLSVAVAVTAAAAWWLTRPRNAT